MSRRASVIADGLVYIDADGYQDWPGVIRLHTSLSHWWLWHVTIPFGAIGLYIQDFREEIPK